MKKYPSRKNIRLYDYDYSQNAFYFVTICINQKKCLLGRIIEDKMYLNDAGKLVEYYYLKIEERYPNFRCLNYIVMPNHIHFIIQINQSDDVVKKIKLSDVILWFKRMTTYKYIKNVKQKNWQKFKKRLWQRNYYDMIIKDEEMFLNIAEYIQNNPYSWHLDKYFDV